MEKRCHQEIREFHQFFEDWFRGSLPNTKENFARVKTAVALDFEIISPDGRLTTRELLLGQLLASHGSHADDKLTFKIWTTDWQTRFLTPQLVVATYAEWQDGDQGKRGRRSTALFAECEEAPNRVQWRHVHETWLP